MDEDDITVRVTDGCFLEGLENGEAAYFFPGQTFECRADQAMELIAVGAVEAVANGS